MHTKSFSYLDIMCYLGSAADGIFPTHYSSVNTVEDFYHISAFASLRQQHRIHHLLTLRQTHSIDGVTFTDKAIAQSYIPFSLPGDFLVTALTSFGIGVMTADCLPVIFYDPEHRVIAIAHAGWRGAVHGIVKQVIVSLQHHYATRIDQLHVLLGPSARACCYRVGHEVIDAVEQTTHYNALHHRPEGVFFDLGMLVVLQLQELGVTQQNILQQHHVCTICNTSYCSYRRQGTASGRQISIVWLA